MTLGGESEGFRACCIRVDSSSGCLKWIAKDSVYLTGLSFARDMPEQVHCRVFCSKDGLHWHLAADSAKSTFEAKAPLPLSRPAHLVKLGSVGHLSLSSHGQGGMLHVSVKGNINPLPSFQKKFRPR